MERCNIQDSVDRMSKYKLKDIGHAVNRPKSSLWFGVRVFYVRFGNFGAQDSASKHLTLKYIPLGTNTILEVNGERSTAYGEDVVSQLRRDRTDEESEDATFVNTDCIKMTGSVIFKVLDADDLLISGVLESFDGNDFTEVKSHGKKNWKIECQAHMSVIGRLLKGNQYIRPGMLLPTVEVYVAGCFSGSPIILCKILELNSSRKATKTVALDSIPEGEYSDSNKLVASSDASEQSDTEDYKPHEVNAYDRSDKYHQMADYMEGDRELSWFNAGVRVGVGLGLGICVGVGLGVGLLVHTNQASSRNFKKWLL